jgi:hypothetical protein
MSQTIKMDITGIVSGVDDLLERTDDRLHRQILENFRRHALLEVSGKLEAILEPEMIVEEPHYVLQNGEETTELRGMDEVRAFYEELRENGEQVMVIRDEQFGVSDTGLAHNWEMNHYYRGENLAEKGVEGVDPDGYYIRRYREVGLWPYDSRGRLEGEHVSRIGPIETIEIPREAFITPEEARAELEPLIRPLPELPAPREA